VSELVEWQRAQLDEDERVARAAERYWHGVRIESATAAEEDHARRHDPARVLAEVDAKRRILDEHPRCPCSAKCTACATCGDGSIWPCQTIRLLALPYADRPEYRNGWRPAD
jgi:hypothetical protein